MSSAQSSFLARHEFLIRRLHSLTGLLPVGAYMCVHLFTNATILDSVQLFQNAIYGIHTLGDALILVEWGFIFLPLIFHAVLGMAYVSGGLPNPTAYSYGSNWRYTLQRATGIIAFLFIFWHVFHMHGWFHAEWWLENVARPLGGAMFSPYNAASTAGKAMQSTPIVPILYTIGVLACVFHFANGLWTMGITWGLWTTPQAQKRANFLSIGVGTLLGIVSLSAIAAFTQVDTKKAGEIEEHLQEKRLESGFINEKQLHHKSVDDHSTDQENSTSKGDETPKPQNGSGT
ncbi:MAG: succinate dehydrogenase cytochrome b558 subunit [Pirellulaceae bacterium]|nr:succinate dehydrogenase cytochrome b558 subunit [Pirellulaceae bacterium]